MAENDRLSRSPVFIMGFGSVVGGERGHRVALINDEFGFPVISRKLLVTYEVFLTGY
jgi:hypothetical protein